MLLDKFKTRKDKYCVVIHPKYGYAYFPRPTGKDIEDFYQNKYYSLIKDGGRAPELRRLTGTKGERNGESKWLENTLYTDINIALKGIIKGIKGKRLLDVGCGPGQFMAFLRKQGWETEGLEPFEDHHMMKPLRGLTIHTKTVAGFLDANSHANGLYDVVTSLNVLEHVLDPVEFLNDLRKLVRKKTGYVCIRVPNDFNDFQYYSQKKNKKSSWWVAAPDHLNYFNTVSLPKVLKKVGFEPVYMMTDFPMEFFVLMGEDYIGNQKLGNLCHQKRKAFEMAISGELRRKVYQAFAGVGIGRNVIVVARRIK